MKKLRIIVATACIALLTACGGESKRYVIRGAVPGGIPNGETVYMTDYSEDVIIDSTNVVDGSFVFESVVDETKAIRLVLNDLYADFVLEKGTTTVDLSDPYSARGTPLNNELGKFWTESEALIGKAREQIAGVDELLSEYEKTELQEEIVTDLFSELETLQMSYIGKHPNDAIGAIIFCAWLQYQTDLPAEKFQEATGHVGEYIRNFGPVKELVAFYEKMEETAAGKPFIDFTIENGNRDGSPVSLSDYVGKGKYVLVDFWASWCQPCRMETPVIAEVYNKYRGERFDVVSVAVWDERENTLAAIEEDGNTWPQILDAQAIPAELYGIRSIPHIILFGPDGTILARDLRGEDLKAKVAEVMN